MCVSVTSILSQVGGLERVSVHVRRECVQDLFKNATVHGRDWYNFWDALVLTLDVTVPSSRLEGSNAFLFTSGESA